MTKGQQRSNREAKKSPPAVGAKPYQLPVKAAPRKKGSK
jgi:hypothetical protein